MGQFDVDLHMVNKTLTTKIMDRHNIFLAFFWKGYYVSCYWHPASKEITLLESHYEFSDEEVNRLTKNFTNAQWGF